MPKSEPITFNLIPVPLPLFSHNILPLHYLVMQASP